MTEREKMLAGQLYDCGDAELLEQWHKAKDLVRDYTRQIPKLQKKRSVFFRSCWAEAEKICGLPHRFMWTMGIIYILGTTAKSI